MKKNRIIYVLWLVAVGCLHIFGNEYGTRVVLYASVIIPAILIFLTWHASRRVAILLETPAKAQQGNAIKIHVQPKGIGLLPGYVKCYLLCKNRLTGEVWKHELILHHAGREEEVIVTHCGVYMLSVAEMQTMDMFGLSAWKAKHMSHENVIVMPKHCNIQLETNAESSVAFDSDEYSMRHPGSDPSETFAIREYAPGDPLKSIHWKLSNKTDRLLVRELGLPIAKNTLVLVETSVPQVFEYKHANMLATAAYSVSHDLVIGDIEHTLAWLDTASAKYESRDISSTTGLDIAVADLLANTVQNCGTSAVEAYSEATEEIRYSHVVVIGINMPRDIRNTFAYSAVTLIDCMGDNYSVIEL